MHFEVKLGFYSNSREKELAFIHFMIGWRFVWIKSCVRTVFYNKKETSINIETIETIIKTNHRVRNTGFHYNSADISHTAYSQCGKAS